MKDIGMRITDALYVASCYAGIDGDHHKAWVIDQMVRHLTGDNYDGWVRVYESGGTYKWDTGIAP